MTTPSNPKFDAVSDAEVLRAARAIAIHDLGVTVAWAQIRKSAQDRYLAHARAALAVGTSNLLDKERAAMAVRLRTFAGGIEVSARMDDLIGTAEAAARRPIRDALLEIAADLDDKPAIDTAATVNANGLDVFDPAGPEPDPSVLVLHDPAGVDINGGYLHRAPESGWWWSDNPDGQSNGSDWLSPHGLVWGVPEGTIRRRAQGPLVVVRRATEDGA